MQALDGIHIEPLPRAVQQAFSEYMHGHSTEQLSPEADLSCIDPSLVRTLMPFQQDGVKYVTLFGFPATETVLATSGHFGLLVDARTRFAI